MAHELLNSMGMNKQPVFFSDLHQMDYKQAWDLQEELLRQNIAVKSGAGDSPADTRNYLLFVEHAPVYTLGKSGLEEHLLISEDDREQRGIAFFRTNRGGDITFHGRGQVVAYPILDLEKFGTDIGKYLRNLEEVIIRSLAAYGIRGQRSAGETGVWIDPEDPRKARKICAMGVRCSRWITMHGLALNVNTDLSYFEMIIPCGIQNKQVSSMQKELGRELDMEEVKTVLKKNFEEVFRAEIRDEAGLLR